MRTLDTRGISRTPIHADPLIWNKTKSAEVTARQLIHTFLSVPQVSTDITQLQPEHKKTLSFLLRTWDENSELLTRGTATNHGVDSYYSWSRVDHQGQTALVVYKPEVIKLNTLFDQALLLNGTYHPDIVLDLPDSIEKRSLPLIARAIR